MDVLNSNIKINRCIGRYDKKTVLSGDDRYQSLCLQNNFRF